MTVVKVGQLVEPEVVASAVEYVQKQISVATERASKLLERVQDCQDFYLWPGSVTKHHAYIGGLVVHTAEVLDISLRCAAARNVEVDREVLTVAAIYHDIGKLRDYALVGGVAPERRQAIIDHPGSPASLFFENTQFRDLIRHVSLSYHEFLSEAEGEGIDKSEFADAVGHCILSHHGRQEWGSPVEPATPEAHILHYADMMSVHAANAR